MTEVTDIELAALERQLVAAPQHPLLALMERAVAGGQPNAVEQVEKLWELYQKVENRNAEAAFNRDFALAQGEIPVIEKHGTIKVKNSHNVEEVRSRYALYEDIDRAVKPVLQKYGFALSFRVETPTKDNHIRMLGVLAHRLGHHVQTAWEMPFDATGSKNPVQAQGSTISYLKRYLAGLLLNFATGEEIDDDGTAAMPGKISAEQADHLKTLLAETESDTGLFLDMMADKGKIDRPPSVDDLPLFLYDRALRQLEQKARDKARRAKPVEAAPQ